ncbi:sugar ABC transporter permease [bacterium]|nr:sugar ABC transporter permease [bacterium]
MLRIKDRAQRRTRLTAYGFILPAALLIFIFHIVPIFISFGLSFFEWDMLGKARFIGLDNYYQLSTDREFWLSVLNTCFYVLGTVPCSIGLALFFALLLHRVVLNRGLYRTIYFLPVITSLNAVALVWTWIYHPQFGLVNGFLSWFGLAPQRWMLEPRGIFDLILKPVLDPIGLTLSGFLAGPSLALTGIIVMSIWKGLGYNIVVLLAGLGTIPRELYEAARLDGAGRLASLRHITVPLISPSLSFLLITSTISSFQVFNQVYLMTQPPGGPLGTTTVAVFYLYEKGFVDFEMGYASALAVVLFVILFTITLIQFKRGGAQQTSL